MKSIGLDIGTTTICALVLGNDDQILYKVTVDSNSFLLSQYEWEKIQDVHIIISKALKLIENCLSQYNDIQYIGLTGQMHGIVYVDDAGKAMSPLYTWQDLRGKEISNDINNYVKYPVASGYGLVTHAYHIRNNMVPENAKYICTIMDYLGMILTKRKKPLIHYSNAASFGFWDIEKNCYEKDILSRFKIDISIIPDITGDIECLGQYKDIPVLIALGDNQASFLSTAGENLETVLVNMGTGGQISLLNDKYVHVTGVETRPFLNGKYLLVGASLCGGRAYAILEKFFRSYVKAATGIDVSQYTVMNSLAKIVHENSLNIKTTLQGTRVYPEEKGTIENITEDNFLPEFMIYGFMEGMIKELYDMYLKMIECIDHEINYLKVSGNAIRKNEILRKICEDIFSLSSKLSEYEEEAASGAALSYKYRKEWEN